MGIRLLIVEDHEMVRSGLVKLVEGTEIEVVGQAKCMAEALECADLQRPDVVLMDVRLPDASSRGAVSALKNRHPEAAVVLLTAYDGPSTQQRYRALGAAGAFVKGSERAELIARLRAAAGHGPLLSGELVAWPTGQLQI